MKILTRYRNDSRNLAKKCRMLRMTTMKTTTTTTKRTTMRRMNKTTISVVLCLSSGALRS
jgi:hypothetical protein